MDIRPIRTPEDYEAAFEILDKHWPAEEGTEEYDYFDISSILILNCIIRLKSNGESGSIRTVNPI